jgi:polysaccharide export outer membrane protein
MKQLLISALIICTVLFSSCADTSKLTYFNNINETKSGDSVTASIYRNNETVIQPNDILSINISSLSPEASKVFNAPNEPGTTTLAGSAVNTLTAGYLVSQTGDIQFPMLGSIHAAGLTKTELSKQLTTLLKEKQLLIDPIVTIRYLNFRVSILGEVAKPGVYTVPIEKLSILEAIGLAGDLTIYGKRDNVLLIRENGEENKIYKRINLSTADILTSPDFYLKSNDVLYVEPTKNRVFIEKTTLALPIIFSFISLMIVAFSQF